MPGPFPARCSSDFPKEEPWEWYWESVSLLSVRDHINTSDKGHSSSISTEESYVRWLALFPGVLGQFTSVTYRWRHPGEANSTRWRTRFFAWITWPAKNRPFPSSPGPLFQYEGRCSAFDMDIIFHTHANKTHFHKKGCAPSLILKVRVFGTRKWPIGRAE